MSYIMFHLKHLFAHVTDNNICAATKDAEDEEMTHPC